MRRQALRSTAAVTSLIALHSHRVMLAFEDICMSGQHTAYSVATEMLTAPDTNLVIFRIAGVGQGGRAPVSAHAR